MTLPTLKYFVFTYDMNKREIIFINAYSNLNFKLNIVRISYPSKVNPAFMKMNALRTYVNQFLCNP